MLVLLSSSHSLSVKDIQEPLSSSLPCVVKYNKEISDSHLADRVGNVSHDNMLAVQGRI